MTTKPNDPGQAGTAAPAQVQTEIPSAVANTGAKSTAGTIAFVSVLAVLGYFVITSGDGKKEAAAGKFETAGSVEIPADLQEKMDRLEDMRKKMETMKGAPPAPGSSTGRPVENAGDAFEEARRRAPAVIYNQSARSGAAPASSSSRFTNSRNSTTLKL